MRASRLPCLLVAVLALSACRPATPETPAATLRPSAEAPSPTPTPPATGESFTPPDPIDAAYAERVLNRLYETEGDAIRITRAAGTVTPEAEALLRSISSKDWADVELEELRRAAESGFVDLRSSPGNSTFRVQRLVTGRPDCMYVIGLKDFTQVLDPPPDRAGERDFVWLEATDQITGSNPTGWRVGAVRTRTDEGVEADPCA